MIPKNLRIAFFGSDAFSVASLARVHALAQKNPSLISSLDVVTRSIKPTGRNLQRLVDVPVGQYATLHSLPVHRADSGSDILLLLDMHAFDLAVAVSYGKLIPGQFLAQMTHGGLNVHPSLLPMYSGSSPIQYALMDDCNETGVTVQTLHPTKFDHGSIVKQSLPVPILDSDNFHTLGGRLADLGAHLLESVILEGLYNGPFEKSNSKYSLAPKILPRMSQIDWTMPSRKIRRLFDALGPLHTYKFVDITKKKKRILELQKVILDRVEEAEWQGAEPGTFKLDSGKLLVKTADGAISIGKLKLQYCGDEDPTTFMKLLRKRVGNTEDVFTNKSN